MINRMERLFKNRKSNIIGKYKKSAVLIPLVEEDGILNIIMEVRALNMKHQPGDICFPGGKIEKGETSEEAAIRETMEELNLKKEDIKLIGEMDYLVTPYNSIIYPFLGQVSNKDIKVNKEEVDHVFKVPIDFFVNNEPDMYNVEVSPKMPKDFPYHLIEGGNNYKFSKGSINQYFYCYKGYVIWGFTAIIIKKFIDIMKGLKK